jgi:hypothetical protein
VQGFAVFPNQPPTEFARIAATGANTIYLDVYWEASSPEANSVEPYSETTPDATVIADVQKAKADGMRVVLMPKIWCNGCQSGWRGFLNPSEPDTFLRPTGSPCDNGCSYGDMVDHYASVAQQHGVWLLFLGSEMNNLQQYTDDWRAIAASVRKRFDGPITYQPNWDQVSSVGFWDTLDLVTVSAYFPLTPTPEPSVTELMQAWHSSKVDPWQGQNWFGELQSLASSTGKQVLIGEVGYRSGQAAAERPWDEGRDETPDQVTQANAYQAILELFSAQPWWMGVIWWQWRGTDAGAGNSDMSPLGKQAEKLLTLWWAQGWRPSPANESAPTGQGAAPSRGNVVATRTAGTAPRPSAATSTSASSTTTTQTPGAPAALDPAGLVSGGDGTTAALGPKPSVHAPKSSGGRDVLIGVAVLGLLGMGAGLLNLARVRVRTPRPLA